MKSFLSHRSNRHGYCGWAVQSADGPVLDWTVSTTREEVRQLCKLRPDLFDRGQRIVKVRVTVEVA